MDDRVRILGFAGSLRKASFNKALLRLAVEMVPYVEDKIDRTGRIIDETTRRKVKTLLGALVAWTRRLREQEYAQHGAYQ